MLNDLLHLRIPNHALNKLSSEPRKIVSLHSPLSRGYPTLAIEPQWESLLAGFSCFATLPVTARYVNTISKVFR